MAAFLANIFPAYFQNHADNHFNKVFMSELHPGNVSYVISSSNYVHTSYSPQNEPVYLKNSLVRIFTLHHQPGLSNVQGESQEEPSCQL